jgi:ABC-2 type transport system ATP-binding protein
MPALIEARDLVKRYPKVTAVDGLSLAIEEGTCFGLLGPNGAGKTTTIEMMEGLTQPTSGAVLFRGAPLDRRFKQEVGIQFQSTTLQDFLTTRECLELFASFYRRTLPIDEIVRMCSLEAFEHQDNRKLSGGQRQRLYLGLALINDPTLLFLDEPTTGLDPQARQNFWELIRKIKAGRKTIVLTTHYMEEAYALCDRIAIMDRGRIIAQGTPEALLLEHFEGVWLELPRGEFTPPQDFPWKVHVTETSIGIHTANVNETLRHLMEFQVSLEGLRVKSPTLDDLFLELTGRELRT